MHAGIHEYPASYLHSTWAILLRPSRRLESPQQIQKSPRFTWGLVVAHHAGNMLQLPNLRPGELLRAGAWRIKNHHYCSQAKASVWRSEGDGVLACGIQRWPRLISKAKLLNVYHVTSVDVSGLMVIHGIRHDCAMVPTTWDEQITFEREVNRNRLFLRACTRNNHDNCNSIW